MVAQPIGVVLRKPKPLWCLALLSAGLTQGQPLQHIMAPLIIAICYV